jgi:hypothetical protein
MDAFRFSPELFEVRADVMAMLDHNGYFWLSHYSSVDCLHDLYGIEVCGVHAKETADVIRQLLLRRFPNWLSPTPYYKDFGREIGWKVKIHRDRPRSPDRWESA